MARLRTYRGLFGFSLFSTFSTKLYLRCLRSSSSSMHENPWKHDEKKVIEVTPGSGPPMSISCGQLARFSEGSCVVQVGDTSVMVTVVKNSRPAASASFLPLMVDFRRKSAAAGRIPMNFLRRETGQSDHDVLTSRMIDRSVRPLFPEGFMEETQIICNLLAVDHVYDPDVLCINAASAALCVSSIPWGGPVGAVRVGVIDDDVVINPTRQQMVHSVVDMIVAAAQARHVVMVDASCKNVSMNVFSNALKKGVSAAQDIAQALVRFTKLYGKRKAPLPEKKPLPPEVAEDLERFCCLRLEDVFQNHQHHKFSRDGEVKVVQEDACRAVAEAHPTVSAAAISSQFDLICRRVFRDLILRNDVRCDGRAMDELRSISCTIDLYKPLHGSALFQRGQTQVLSTVTFDSPDSAVKMDSTSALLGGIKEKNFFLHYEFPPYATNEIGKAGSIGRRELGHGALAEKALRPVVPSDHPFTIRLTAEVLESNGSSSMASVCGGSLALMDAGVKLSDAAAGVAIGLVTRTDAQTGQITEYKLLTDILGIEDYMGDMDFKMAGTTSGITALQADVKLPGLPIKIIMEAIQAAHDGRQKVLKIMNSAIRRARPVPKSNAPVIEVLEVPLHKRSLFVGLSGLNLKKLSIDTGVTISTIDDTKFQIFAPNPDSLQEAKAKIEILLQEEKEPQLEFGAMYTAKITEIREYGVMVQLYPSMAPTLVHNSQLDTRKVSHPSALNLEVGQELRLKYFGRDPADGRMRLSRKALLALNMQTLHNLVSS